MPVINSSRRIVIIFLFFFALALVLTLLGLGSTAAYASPGGGTPPPTDASLRGSIDLQGRQLHPKPDAAWSIPVVVSLWNPGSPPGSLPVYEFSTTTNPYGVFQVGGNITPGTYDIRVKGLYTLRNLVKDVTLVAGDNFQDFGQLVAGDVELVSTFNRLVFDPEFFMFIAAQGKCEGDAGYDARFDLFVDGCINGDDWGILLPNVPDWPDASTDGDIDVTDDVVPGPLLGISSESSAVLTFDPTEKEVGIDEDTTASIKVTPCCNTEINYVKFTLGFSPTLIQVNDIVTSQMPLVMSKTIDNVQGMVHLEVGKPGSPFTKTVTVANLSFKAITTTSGTIITPTYLFVSGPNPPVTGTVTQSLSVKTKTCGGGYCYYLPIIFRNSS